MPREFSDPYVYPGTSVLKNKAGLQNDDALRTFEYERTAKRSAELAIKPIAGRFDLKHLQAIHKYLFQDIYAWAGALRSVNISKNPIPFAQAAYIDRLLLQDGCNKPVPVEFVKYAGLPTAWSAIWMRFRLRLERRTAMASSRGMLIGSRYLNARYMAEPA